MARYSPRMFIRRANTRNRKTGEAYFTHRLVEAVRVGTAIMLELDSRFTCLGFQPSNSKHLSAMCPVYFLQCGAMSRPVARRP